MNRNRLKAIIIILCALLAAELIFVGVMHFTEEDQVVIQTPPTTTSAPTTEAPTTLPPTTAAPTTEPTTVPTTEPPQPEYYTLTFVGDCTLGSDPYQFNTQYSFVHTVGEDYEYPFRNVREYFDNDDFTFINLEVVLGEKGPQANKTFVFRAPEEFTQILTSSSVEGVTLANNHTEDFGAEGYAYTKELLDNAGVAYVEEDKTNIFVTESGLVLGLYADSFGFDKNDIQENIAQLQEDGAEIIICAFHWGTENSYRYNGTQQTYAEAAIDAGADIVVGHHPHVLQEIVEYNGGIIYYSLGNFSFGGNRNPRDKDTVVVQQQIVRDVDGTVSLGELTLIPTRISSITEYNNYQPTPYEEGTEEYDRTLSKLDGTFTGPDLNTNYDYSKE